MPIPNINSMSGLLATVKATSALPVQAAYLAWRHYHGKETSTSLAQRLGISSESRSPGPLIWFHATTMGECAVALPVLFRCLSEYNEKVCIMLTTASVKAYKMLRSSLPKRVTVQMVPLDNAVCVSLFLQRWKPTVGIIVETPYLPQLVLLASQHGVKLALINAVIHTHNLLGWHARRSVRNLLGKILEQFSLIVPQSDVDVGHFRIFGASMKQMPGWCNELKYAALMGGGVCHLWQPDKLAEQQLSQIVNRRPAWLAANTVYGEEPFIGQVHMQLSAQLPGLLTVIAPHDSGRCGEIAAHLVSKCGLRVAIWNTQTLARDVSAVDILLVDDSRQLPLLYSVLEVTVMGNSLVEGCTGHGLAQAAVSGTALVIGPHAGSSLHMVEELNNAALLSAEEVAGAVRATGQQMEDPSAASDPPSNQAAAAGGESLDGRARAGSDGEADSDDEAEAGPAGGSPEARRVTWEEEESLLGPRRSIIRDVWSRSMSRPGTAPALFGRNALMSHPSVESVAGTDDFVDCASIYSETDGDSPRHVVQYFYGSPGISTRASLVSNAPASPATTRSGPSVSRLSTRFLPRHPAMSNGSALFSHLSSGMPHHTSTSVGPTRLARVAYDISWEAGSRTGSVTSAAGLGLGSTVVPPADDQQTVGGGSIDSGLLTGYAPLPGGVGTTGLWDKLFDPSIEDPMPWSPAKDSSKYGTPGSASPGGQPSPTQAIRPDATQGQAATSSPALDQVLSSRSTEGLRNRVSSPARQRDAATQTDAFLSSPAGGLGEPGSPVSVMLAAMLGAMTGAHMSGRSTPAVSPRPTYELAPAGCDASLSRALDASAHSFTPAMQHMRVVEVSLAGLPSRSNSSAGGRAPKGTQSSAVSAASSPGPGSPASSAALELRPSKPLSVRVPHSTWVATSPAKTGSGGSSPETSPSRPNLNLPTLAMPAAGSMLGGAPWAQQTSTHAALQMIGEPLGSGDFSSTPNSTDLAGRASDWSDWSCAGDDDGSTGPQLSARSAPVMKRSSFEFSPGRPERPAAASLDNSSSRNRSRLARTDGLHTDPDILPGTSSLITDALNLRPLNVAPVAGLDDLTFRPTSSFSSSQLPTTPSATSGSQASLLLNGSLKILAPSPSSNTAPSHARRSSHQSDPGSPSCSQPSSSRSEQYWSRSESGSPTNPVGRLSVAGWMSEVASMSTSHPRSPPFAAQDGSRTPPWQRVARSLKPDLETLPSASAGSSSTLGGVASSGMVPLPPLPPSAALLPRASDNRLSPASDSTSDQTHKMSSSRSQSRTGASGAASRNSSFSTSTGDPLRNVRAPRQSLDEGPFLLSPSTSLTTPRHSILPPPSPLANTPYGSFTSQPLSIEELQALAASYTTAEPEPEPEEQTPDTPTSRLSMMATTTSPFSGSLFDRPDPFSGAVIDENAPFMEDVGPAGDMPEASELQSYLRMASMNMSQHMQPFRMTGGAAPAARSRFAAAPADIQAMADLAAQPYESMEQSRNPEPPTPTSRLSSVMSVASPFSTGTFDRPNPFAPSVKSDRPAASSGAPASPRSTSSAAEPLGLLLPVPPLQVAEPAPGLDLAPRKSSVAQEVVSPSEASTADGDPETPRMRPKPSSELKQQASTATASRASSSKVPSRSGSGLIEISAPIMSKDQVGTLDIPKPAAGPVQDIVQDEESPPTSSAASPNPSLPLPSPCKQTPAPSPQRSIRRAAYQARDAVAQAADSLEDGSPVARSLLAAADAAAQSLNSIASHGSGGGSEPLQPRSPYRTLFDASGTATAPRTFSPSVSPTHASTSRLQQRSGSPTHHTQGSQGDAHAAAMAVPTPDVLDARPSGLFSRPSLPPGPIFVDGEAPEDADPLTQMGHSICRLAVAVEAVLTGSDAADAGAAGPSQASASSSSIRQVHKGSPVLTDALQQVLGLIDSTTADPTLATSTSTLAPAGTPTSAASPRSAPAAQFVPSSSNSFTAGAGQPLGTHALDADLTRADSSCSEALGPASPNPVDAASTRISSTDSSLNSSGAFEAGLVRSLAADSRGLLEEGQSVEVYQANAPPSGTAPLVLPGVNGPMLVAAPLELVSRLSYGLSVSSSITLSTCSSVHGSLANSPSRRPDDNMQSLLAAMPQMTRLRLPNTRSNSCSAALNASRATQAPITALAITMPRTAPAAAAAAASTSGAFAEPGGGQRSAAGPSRLAGLMSTSSMQHAGPATSVATVSGELTQSSSSASSTGIAQVESLGANPSVLMPVSSLSSAQLSLPEVAMSGSATPAAGLVNPTSAGASPARSEAQSAADSHVSTLDRLHLRLELSAHSSMSSRSAGSAAWPCLDQLPSPDKDKPPQLDLNHRAGLNQAQPVTPHLMSGQPPAVAPTLDSSSQGAASFVPTQEPPAPAVALPPLPPLPPADASGLQFYSTHNPAAALIKKLAENPQLGSSARLQEPESQSSSQAAPSSGVTPARQETAPGSVAGSVAASAGGGDGGSQGSMLQSMAMVGQTNTATSRPYQPGGGFVLPATQLSRTTGPAVWHVSEESELTTTLLTLLRDPIERRSRGLAAAQAAAKLASSLVNTVWHVLDDSVITPALHGYVQAHAPTQQSTATGAPATPAATTSTRP